jgi:HD-like signal output (HDOD) protein
MATPTPPTAQTERAQILKTAATLGILGGSAAGTPRVMAALTNPEIGASDLGALLRTQPGLSARVLRVANSPYYGQPRAITSVDRAVVVLGLNAVRGIAAAACFDRAAGHGSPQQALDIPSVVRHSLATGIVAESIARLAHPTLAAEAFIAGLLHNFGIFVQVAMDRPGIEAMIAARKAGDRRDMRVLEAERAAVGHEACVAALFEAWQLPNSLIAAARDHHDPMAAAEPHRLLATMVHVSAQLALENGTAFSLEVEACVRAPALLDYLRLAEADLSGITRELPSRLSALLGALRDS